jgi:heme exporter protein B
MSETPLELAVAAKAAGALADHRAAAGHRDAAARPVHEPRRQASAAVALTLLAGTPALTFIGLIGAALSVALRRGGLLLAVLVLAADRAGADLRRRRFQRAIVGPLPFGTPFTILCALTLISLVVGIFAAAAALRQGME